MHECFHCPLALFRSEKMSFFEKWELLGVCWTAPDRNYEIKSNN